MHLEETTSFQLHHNAFTLTLTLAQAKGLLLQMLLMHLMKFMFNSTITTAVPDIRVHFGRVINSGYRTPMQLHQMDQEFTLACLQAKEELQEVIMTTGPLTKSTACTR